GIRRTVPTRRSYDRPRQRRGTGERGGDGEAEQQRSCGHGGFPAWSGSIVHSRRPPGRGHGPKVIVDAAGAAMAPGPLDHGFASVVLAGTANGIESGDTAPPEMMKLIAWSTVQSVGVIFSTGTISR